MLITSQALNLLQFIFSSSVNYYNLKYRVIDIPPSIADYSLNVSSKNSYETEVLMEFKTSSITMVRFINYYKPIDQ